MACAVSAKPVKIGTKRKPKKKNWCIVLKMVSQMTNTLRFSRMKERIRKLTAQKRNASAMEADSHIYDILVHATKPACDLRISERVEVPWNARSRMKKM